MSSFVPFDVGHTRYGLGQVDASPNPSKEQLIDAVQRHFMSQVTLQNLTTLLYLLFRFQTDII